MKLITASKQNESGILYWVGNEVQEVEGNGYSSEVK
jgi:hypothetical protein